MTEKSASVRGQPRQVAKRGTSEDERHSAPSASYEGDGPDSTAYLAEVFDAAAVAAVVLDPDELRIVATNAAYLRATGRERPDLIGRPFFEVFPAEDVVSNNTTQARLREAFARVLRTREPVLMPMAQYDMPDPDGAAGLVERWWTTVIAPVLDGDGGVKHLVAQVEDVSAAVEAAAAARNDRVEEREATIFRLRQSNLALARESEARRRSEDELRRNARLDEYRLRLNEALRSASDPLDVQAAALRIICDHLGADVAYFAVIDEVTGHYDVSHCHTRGDRATLVGRYPVDLYGETSERLRVGESLIIEDASNDPRLNQPTSEAMLSHGLWASVTASVVRGGRWRAILNVISGAPRRWTPDEVALVEETAERTWPVVEKAQAEELVRDSSTTLQQLVHDAPFGIYAVDADLRIVQASRAAQRTFGIEDLIGMDLSEALSAIWPDPFRSEVVARFLETLATGVPYESEQSPELRSDSGLAESYDWRLARFPMPDHRHGVVCYFYDLTERRQFEDLLRRRDDQLSALNASLENQVAERTAELRRSEARFRMAFASGPVAGCVSTLDQDRLLEVNRAFEDLTGYAAEEVVGRTAREVGLWASGSPAAEGADGYRDRELTVVTKDGAVLDILASATRMSWGGEDVRLKMFIDITANKRNQAHVNRAISEIMSDTAWFSRKLVERLSQAGEPTRASERDVALTTRERQVLSRLAVGMTDKAIASELGVSQQTVRNHVTRIYAKIKVRSRSQAVVWARENGIVVTSG